jgi:hypothetical protein
MYIFLVSVMHAFKIDFLPLQEATSWHEVRYEFTNFLDAVHSSKTSVNFYHTKQQYIPDDSNPQRDLCQLKAMVSINVQTLPQGHNAAGRIRSIEKSNDLAGN